MTCINICSLFNFFFEPPITYRVRGLLHIAVDASLTREVCSVVIQTSACRVIFPVSTGKNPELTSLGTDPPLICLIAFEVGIVAQPLDSALARAVCSGDIQTCLCSFPFSCQGKSGTGRQAATGRWTFPSYELLLCESYAESSQALHR